MAVPLGLRPEEYLATFLKLEKAGPFHPLMTLSRPLFQNPL